jgi:hypothetical protein
MVCDTFYLRSKTVMSESRSTAISFCSPLTNFIFTIVNDSRGYIFLISIAGGSLTIESLWLSVLSETVVELLWLSNCWYFLLDDIIYTNI